MSKKYQKRQQQKKEPKKPSYYRKNCITVGMLEDLCRGIADKSALIQIGDRYAGGPEVAIKTLLITKNNKPKALTICGKFNWSNPDAEEDEVEDEGDVDSDDDEGATAWDLAQRGGGAACAYMEPGDCVDVDGIKLVYLGEECREPTKSA